MLRIIFQRMKRPLREVMPIKLGGDCVMNVASTGTVDNFTAFSDTKASSPLTCRTGDVS
jgi:hypothetical protein